MDEAQKFLADRLLSEEQPITYRVLSRAVDVHVNKAKQMLWDFHKYQNAQRPDSVHATYLIYGTKTVKNVEKDGDVEMSSSIPEDESSSGIVSTRTLTLAREGNLSDILAEYQQVTSIHVYSLSPHPQKDLTLLCDVSKSVADYASSEDASIIAKKYGIIVNPNMRRRDPNMRPRAAIASAPKLPVSKEPASAKPSQATAIKKEAVEAGSKEASPSSSASVPSSKRAAPGGIMQSFAKAASKPAKPKVAPKKEEQESMALSDDGEAEDDDIPQPRKKEAADTEAARKSRKEREEELRRMMEEDDEDEDEDNAEEREENDPADDEMEEASEPEPEPEPESKQGETKEKEPAEVISSSGDGRRRGKRPVMKKKRILDDQGYMVTIQEQGWESFSEDEVQPPAKKTASSTSTPASSAPKAKKPAGKTGQGNIMSFFAKK